MTVFATEEELLAHQAEKIAERAAVGTKTGTYAVTRLGPRFALRVAHFVTSSPEAEAAWIRFTRSVFDFERRRTVASLAFVESNAAKVDELIAKAGLDSKQAAALREELQNHRLALQKLDEKGKAFAEKVGSAGKKAPVQSAAARQSAAKLASDVHVGFLDIVAGLSHAAAAGGAEEEAFMVAYRKFSAVIGTDLEGGWKTAVDLMLSFPDEVKAYRKEIERLESAIAKETDAAKLAQLTNRALPATRKSGVHSVLKGLLGELFTVKWEDWALIKSGYSELAERLAQKLGSDWEVLSVRGNMKLNGKDTWDEAVLLLNKNRIPPEAKLYMGAQVKTALTPTSLDQTLNDIAREAEKNELRIGLADGREEVYLLTPLPAGETTHRFVINAQGGAYPPNQIANLIANGVQVEQQTLPMSVEEFNLLADRLLKACADLLNKK